jgi:hypothetical protein
VMQCMVNTVRLSRGLTKELVRVTERMTAYYLATCSRCDLAALYQDGLDATFGEVISNGGAYDATT